MEFSISRQFSARAFLCFFFLATDHAASYFAKFVPLNHWTYIALLGASFTVFLATCFLGKGALENDIREICFYDVLAHTLCVGLYLSNLPTQQLMYSLMSSMIFLKYGRLLWPCKASDGGNFTAWPTFGILGIVTKLVKRTPAEPATHPTRGQSWAAYLFIIFCFAAGFTVMYFFRKLSVRDIFLTPMLLIPFYYRRILSYQQAQSENVVAAFAREQRAIALAAQQVAAAQEQLNQALSAHNRELTQAKAELEQANMVKQRALDELARMNGALRDAAHDLQAPLSSINLRADKLLRAESPRERDRAAAQLTAAVDHMGQALFDTVHEAKVVTGIVPPHISAIAIDELLEDIVEELNEEAMKRGLADISMFTPEDEELLVACDMRLLRRIVYNLARNAIVHIPAGCRLLLAARQKHGAVLVQVWDNGTGMADLQGKDGVANFLALIERIRHEAQAQASENTTGHGLGLNNVQQMANVLGVQVGVRSYVGRGTVFSFVLALASAELIAATQAVQEEEDRLHALL